MVPQLSLTKVTSSYWRYTFDHPPLNLIDGDTLRELSATVDELESNDALKVVVFDSAHPDYFFARYDLTASRTAPSGPVLPGFATTLGFLPRLTRAPVISIAAIRGRTRGGGSEFALACDLRFASREKAIFGQPEVPSGILPGAGAVERLPLLAGRSRALEIIVSGDDYDAATAEQYGWITRSLPDAELDSFVDRFARRIASFDKAVLARAKHLVNRRTLPPDDDSIETQGNIEELAKSPAMVERLARARARAKEVGAAEFELRLGHHLGQI